MKDLKIAIPKGYLYSPTIIFLKKAGWEIDFDFGMDRKLSQRPQEDSPEFLLARAKDVPSYVEYGVADMGITGQDVLIEKDKDICELMNLNYGLCKMVLATANEKVEKYKKDINLRDKRIATNYPRITREYFRAKGLQVEIIELYGSVELAPVYGLSELIVDLSVTGKTLSENGLAIIDTIQEYTARLIANTVSFQLKREAINNFCRKTERVIKRG